MVIKVPTLDDFLDYKGAHCHQLWTQVGPDWRCPSCQRSKFEQLRWTTRFPGSPHAFKGWIAVLHRHHDHSVGFMERGVRRFSETVICDQCNAADGAAKRKLKLPEKFSYSPQEISLFVVANPHSKHTIKYEVAAEIYERLFNLPPLPTRFGR